MGDASFDSAAYAAYQALFDVPAGQYAPALQRNVTATPLQSMPEQSAHFAANAADSHLCRGGFQSLEVLLCDSDDTHTGKHCQHHLSGHNVAGAALGDSPLAAEQQSMAAACAAFLQTEQGRSLLRQALQDASRGDKQT